MRLRPLLHLQPAQARGHEILIPSPFGGFFYFFPIPLSLFILRQHFLFTLPHLCRLPSLCITHISTGDMRSLIFLMNNKLFKEKYRELVNVSYGHAQARQAATTKKSAGRMVCAKFFVCIKGLSSWEVLSIYFANLVLCHIGIYLCCRYI